MLRLKEFYHYKRDLLKWKKALKSKSLLRVKKSPFLSSKWKVSPLLKRENQGILFVRSSFNNTILALTDLRGKVKSVKSAGGCGFQGKKKRSTKFAVESTLDSILEVGQEQGVKKLFLCLKGFSKSRSYLLKCLKKKRISLLGVRDVTPNPHNGCRPKKLRRG